MKPCAFCTLPPERIIDSARFGLVIRDGFPISLGHTLIIPKRHVGSFFDLEPEERSDLLVLLDRAKLVSFAGRLRHPLVRQAKESFLKLLSTDPPLR